MLVFKITSKIILGLFILAFINPAGLFAQDEPEVLTESELLRLHTGTLASSEMDGRLPVTEGNVKAADYIINEFKKSGVKPAGASFKQNFPVISGVKLGPGNETSFNVYIKRPGVPKEMWTKVPKKWDLNTHWIPLGFSKSGKVEGDMVFVGYGISAKDKNYDDYTGVDVKDKIVIALTNAPHDPMKTKNKYELKKYTEFAAYTSLEYKAKNAYDHGAKAIIFIKVQSDSANILMPLKNYPGFNNPGIIAIHANRTEISKMFPKKSLFPSEEKINDTRVPDSYPISDASVSISVDLAEGFTDVPNVIGMVAGTDPSLANEYIIVGAHFDHLGWERGGQRFTYSAKQTFIYNGADDNASGTAAMICLAGRIAKNPLKRTVLFVGFNAEEGGLKGSNFFVNNPPKPIEQCKFMLNLDMIGKVEDNTFNVLGTAGNNALAGLVNEQAVADSIVTIIKNETAPEPGSHEAFAKKNIPSLMFFTDKHEDIHTPNDDPEKLHYKGMMLILNYAEGLLRRFDGKGI